MGALVDNFFGGSLGGKGWPTGTIKVAELCGEFSFLGVEAITRCCKYLGYLNNAWMLQDMQKDLFEGGIFCSVKLAHSYIKLLHFCVMLKCRAGKAPLGIQDGALGVHPVRILNNVAKPVSTCCTVYKGEGVAV